MGSSQRKVKTIKTLLNSSGLVIYLFSILTGEVSEPQIRCKDWES